ncbi:MAG: DUF922 domain-containing Zn-dependent protease [Anaerolineales bacterium]|nr:DUF922 domain-containing Zn-dependent protease [Anaerolineales bacterium]
MIQPGCDPARDLDLARWRRDYRVRGVTLDQLQASMALHRPTDEAGMKWDAVTTWDVRWTYPYVEQERVCQIGEPEVAVDISMQLPLWNPPREADPAQVEDWRRFIRALETHEEGHAQIAIAAACEVRHVLMDLPAQTHCDALELSADRVTQVVIYKYRGQEASYDSVTGHGETQGALLP